MADTFAARVTALNDLARRILAAKAAGDTATADRLLAEFRARLGTANLPALAAEAKAREMPSDFLMRLAGVGETLDKLLRWLPWLLGLGVVGYLLVRRLGRGGS